ncbi:conserved protein of unknown function [Modestobacter italicus]|uniref:Uncharacterized protein n=1 Tax=Modestobacter italicus (strain DSM 44449 / CECT 9708 / BC 501) TaxID=2732864 RepID=I4EWI2_MODI5|nr:hypothetical protein [Modestobacter marinus]CCH87745.1 conserved protein of unknown function [Modestobacter marinus]
MRLRRRHRDDWSLPSGLAEVELFRFWEEDLVGDLPPEVVAVGPPPAVRAGAPGPAAAEEPSESSTDPLWWAVGLVFVAVLLAVVV